MNYHTTIHDDMAFLIRQFELTDITLTIKVYMFTNDTDWIRYEALQMDIFYHQLTIVPDFDLSIFQNPTGSNCQGLNH